MMEGKIEDVGVNRENAGRRRFHFGLWGMIPPQLKGLARAGTKVTFTGSAAELLFQTETALRV